MDEDTKALTCTASTRFDQIRSGRPLEDDGTRGNGCGGGKVERSEGQHKLPVHPTSGKSDQATRRHQIIVWNNSKSESAEKSLEEKQAKEVPSPLDLKGRNSQGLQVALELCFLPFPREQPESGQRRESKQNEYEE